MNELKKKLLPCSVCNGLPNLISCVEDRWQYTHSCRINELSVVMKTAQLNSKEEALEAWNTRSNIKKENLRFVGLEKVITDILYENIHDNRTLEENDIKKYAQRIINSVKE